VSLLGLTLVSAAVAGVFVGNSSNGSSAMALVSLVQLPRAPRDLVFLGHLHYSSPLSGIPNAAAYAVVAYIAVTVAAYAVLFWRYREVDL
jgi:hypothetical protein